MIIYPIFGSQNKTDLDLDLALALDFYHDQKLSYLEKGFLFLAMRFLYNTHQLGYLLSYLE